MNFVLKGGEVYKEGKILKEDLYIKDGYISAPFEGATEVKVEGLTILPGMIDTQVHLREPGLTHKEDLISGSRQAVLGGVTGFFEMPNTTPPTTDAIALKDKLTRCEGKSWSNYAFYIGATHGNIDKLESLAKLDGACGVKIFMGSSTGSLLVSEIEYLEQIVSQIKCRFAVHSESERVLKQRYKELFTDPEKEYPATMHPEWRNEEVAMTSTKQIVELSKKYNAKLHILHISSADEMDYLEKNKYPNMSIEVLPQHLSLTAPECYERLGTLAQMNPPIRSKRHTERLWKAVNSGLVDVLGSDHAPHTLEEKNRPYPKSPAGLPGVQTTLPLMLTHVHNEKLSLKKLVDLFSINPAKLFGMPGLGELKIGRRADLSIVDLSKKQKITKDWLASRVKWSPFEDYEVTGWPVMTVVSGEIACRDGELLGRPRGRQYDF